MKITKHAIAYEPDELEVDDTPGMLATAQRALELFRLFEGIPDPADYIRKVEALRAALTEISEGKGAFSRDPLTHAENTIDDMKSLAVAALDAFRDDA